MAFPLAARRIVFSFSSVYKARKLLGITPSCMRYTSVGQTKFVSKFSTSISFGKCLPDTDNKQLNPLRDFHGNSVSSDGGTHLLPPNPLDAAQIVLSDDHAVTREDGVSDNVQSQSSRYVDTEKSAEIQLTDAELETSLVAEGDLPSIPKRVFEPEYHLSAYVSQCETLIQLVKLGVDLARMQRVEGIADFIIKTNFETDIKPHLFFLHRVGVSDEDLGNYISMNPLIFKEDLETLEGRVDYLRSKRFSPEAIARIVSSAYVFLLLPVKTVDRKFGYLQKQFRLSGNEVRLVATKLPKLITFKLTKIMDNRFYIKEFLGFSDSELKELILRYPKIFIINKYALGRRFDFLYNTMEISHARLLEWPFVLGTREKIVEYRHRFLLSVDRAQYDPTKENFVSLKALVTGSDGDFCTQVAKTSVSEYNNYLKLI